MTCKKSKYRHAMNLITLFFTKAMEFKLNDAKIKCIQKKEI